MELNNEFRVAVPAAKVWEVFTDVERVAPCLPGATLLSVDGDDVHRRGQGQGRPDHGVLQGRCVLSRRRTQRRNGSCSRPRARRPGATAPPPPSSPRSSRTRATPTYVVITTDLAISGKAAQFGRGVLADVSGNLIAQFARSLEAELLGGRSGPPAAPKASRTARTAATAAAPPDAGDSVDLLKVVAVPMAKRSAPVAAAVAAAGAVGFLLGRRSAGPGRSARRRPAGRAGAAAVVKAAAVRLSPARHGRRGGGRCSPSTATTRRSSPADRAWCRCWRCG